MRRGRIFIYIGLILILGLIAVGAFYFRSQQNTGPITVESTQVPEEVLKTPVVFMSQSVKRGQRITEDVVTIVQMAQEDVVEGMFTDTEEVIGSFAKFDLIAGVPVTRGVVVDKAEELSSAGSNHAIFIPPGMVAVSIPVDRLSSVAYGIQRGDHVNVIVTLLMVDLDSDFQSKLPNSSSSILAPGPGLVLSQNQAQAEGPDTITTQVLVDELLQTLVAQVATGGVVSPIGRLELDQQMGQPFYIVPSEPQRPRLVSQTLIQNVIVLQMGTFSLEEQTPAIAATPETPDQQQTQDGNTQDTQAATPTVETPDVVTLIVSPQDAVTLNYLLLNQGARLSLALRSAGDDSQTATEAVTLQFLIDQYNIPLPTKLPYGLEPRLDLIVPPVLINDIPPATTDQ